jgi:hypothetical protein
LKTPLRRPLLKNRKAPVKASERAVVDAGTDSEIVGGKDKTTLPAPPQTALKLRLTFL